jgi:hypothetical protein
MCSLALDVAGHPHISYTSVIGENEGLKYATTVILTKSIVEQDLATLKTTVTSLPSSDFKQGTKGAELAIINAAEINIRVGNYHGAIVMLRALLPRTDGCAKNGMPDRDDWVRTCAAQSQLYPQVQNLVQELQALHAA